MEQLQSQFFDRQMKLGVVGEKGQKKLLNSHALILGAGGLGCSVISSLIRSGIGKITIVDFDKVDISNLHRQTLFHQNDIGKYKAVVASVRVQEIAPWVECDVVLERFNLDSASDIYTDQDVIIDCTDNLKTKFFTHDFAYANKIDLIISSIHKFDGQLQVFKFSKSRDKACMRCLWDIEPKQIGSCDDNGVMGTVPVIFGTLQANEAIKLILEVSQTKENELITFDLINMEMNKLTFPKNNKCSLCSTDGEMKNQKSIDIYINDDDLDKFKWIDIRKSTKHFPLPDFINEENLIVKPQEEVLEEFESYAKDQDYLILCDAGVRSTYLTIELRERGFSNVYNFSGGFSEFLRGM